MYDIANKIKDKGNFMKLSEIAALIHGSLVGDDMEITGVSNLDHQDPKGIAYADSKKNLKILKNTAVAALILNKELEYDSKPVIKVSDAKRAFSILLRKFSPYSPYPSRVYPQAYVDDKASLGKNATVMPFACVMENAIIGDNTVIYPHVFIGKNCRIGADCIIKSGVKIDDFAEIGDRVIIHHNSVIGGDGFGYIQHDGRNEKIPQIGRIIIENDVEIGACVTVDRATIGETHIGRGVKIDNLVQIAHNVTIGENSIIVAQVGIAGSTTLGKNCILAGQVGVADHVTIGDNVVVMAQAGIDKKKIESDSVLFGTPARDVMLTKRIYASQEKLPDLIKTVRELKKRMENE